MNECKKVEEEATTIILRGSPDSSESRILRRLHGPIQPHNLQKTKYKIQKKTSKPQNHKTHNEADLKKCTLLILVQNHTLCILGMLHLVCIIVLVLVCLQVNKKTQQTTQITPFAQSPYKCDSPTLPHSSLLGHPGHQQGSGRSKALTLLIIVLPKCVS